MLSGEAIRAGLPWGGGPVPYLLINPAPDLAGHVVTFDRWTDTTMTSYEGFERSGDSGTHHRVIPYPYFGDYLMSPYRLSN